MAAAKVPDDFELIAAMQKAKGRAEDFRLLQDAVAGRETGHGNRHHMADKGAQAEQARKRHLDRMISALDILLADPAYRAHYEAFGEFLSAAETATATALTQTEATLEEAKDQFKTVLAEANALPNGTKVFRAADGRIVDEHGKVVGPSDAAGIVWKEGAPSYEDYRSAKKLRDEALELVDDIRRYQTDILGRARDRWEDQENPITPEEMDELKREIEAQNPVVSKSAPAEPKDLPSDATAIANNTSKPPI